jgi:hypothetical protein
MGWRPPEHKPDDDYMVALMKAATRRHDPRTLAGRARLVDSVMPALRRVRHPVYRDGYLQLLARLSGVDETVLRETLNRREEGSGHSMDSR